jgi:hypothetical protein
MRTLKWEHMPTRGGGSYICTTLHGSHHGIYRFPRSL